MSSPRRVGRGLYTDVDPSHLPTWEALHQISLARCAAAILLSPSARCLSHESAALLHGIPVRDHEPDVHLIMATSPRHASTVLPALAPGRTGIRIRRHRRRLPRTAITMVSGLPVTTALRTALDCALDLPAQESVCIVDGALRALVRPVQRGSRAERRRVHRDTAHLLDLLRRAIDDRAGQPGTRRARAVVSIASPLAESPGESVLRWLVAALGLPMPQLQMGIEVDGWLWFPDLSWPDVRIYLEFDGELKYQDREDLWREKRRRDALAAAGWRCLHVTWADLRNPSHRGQRSSTSSPLRWCAVSRPWPRCGTEAHRRHHQRCQRHQHCLRAVVP